VAPDTSFKAARRAYYQSSSFKLAMFFTLLLGTAALILGWYLFSINRDNLVREASASIDAELSYLKQIRDINGSEDMSVFIEVRSQGSDFPLYRLEGEDGAFLLGNLETTPALVEIMTEGLISFKTEDNISVAAKIETFADGRRLLVGKNIVPLLAAYSSFRWASILIIGFMLVVILASFFVSIFVVSRINIIASAAEAIVRTGDLSQRISIAQSWDDLSNLAQTLNLFLDRIESLMKGIQSVGDNIAHDLRTPLTRLRVGLENLSQKNLKEEQVNTLVEEADQLLSTFNSLLRISRLEMGHRRREFSQLDLVEMLGDVFELYEPFAEEKEVRLNLKAQKPSLVEGDRDLIFQVFANLFDNAIKFSPAGGEVMIQIQKNAKGVSVIISDQGPGLSELELEKVFDRFYRADQSRTLPGNGLGLSLVKAIMAYHQGTISIENRDHGLAVRLGFESAKANNITKN
jgi:signal transduction histidine kinase